MADKTHEGPGSGPDSNGIFMRERIILHVANLRYEFDLIGILTPLPPSRLVLVSPPDLETKYRRPAPGG